MNVLTSMFSHEKNKIKYPQVLEIELQLEP